MPRERISGFSGYICKRCMLYDLTPIKDLDLTASARHKCSIERSEQARRLVESDKNIFQELQRRSRDQLISFINWWIPGKKFLISQRLSIEKILEPEIAWGNRYPIVNLLVSEKPWLERATGGPKEIDHSNLADFVDVTGGTFGVFPIFNEPGYKLLYLTSATRLPVMRKFNP